MIARSFVAFAVAALAAGSLTAWAAPGGGHGPKPKPNSGVAKGRPGRGKAPMTAVDVAADDAGRIETRRFPGNRKHGVREWLRFKLRKLDAGASYSIWIDDPATADPANPDWTVFGGTFTTNATGEANVFVDTKKGDAMPFPGRDPAVTLTELTGLAVQVRVGDGADTVVDDGVNPPVVTPAAVVLTGTIPALK